MTHQRILTKSHLTLQSETNYDHRFLRQALLPLNRPTLERAEISVAADGLGAASSSRTDP